MISTNIPKGSRVEFFDRFVVVLVSFNKVEVKGDGKDIKKRLNLEQDISFRADGFSRCVILSRLMKVQTLEKSLAV